MGAAAKAAEFGNAAVADLVGLQLAGQRVEIVLRVGSRARDGSDVDHQLDLPGAQQVDEIGNAARRMANGEDRREGPSTILRMVPLPTGSAGREDIHAGGAPSPTRSSSMSGIGRSVISLFTVRTMRRSTSL